MRESESKPQGDLVIRVVAMPADLNPTGNVFGGWILSQMDIGGGLAANERAKGRVATVAITAMEFHHPVFVGDLVSCYTEITKVGKTSITVHVQTWAHHREASILEEKQVTAGDFVFVALDDEGNKREVPAAS